MKKAFLILMLVFCAPAFGVESQPVQKAQIPVATLQAIVQYLTERPYKEVAQLIQLAAEAEIAEDCKNETRENESE